MNKSRETEMSILSNELITRKYLFNKMEASRDIRIQDYIVMHLITEMNKDCSISDGRAYLRDIAEKMNLTIRHASKLAGELKDKGLIKWIHEGDGSNGTFLEITDEGCVLFEKEKIRLEKFYGDVIEKFGVDNLRQMLNLMKQFEKIVSGELEDEMHGEEY